MKETEQSTPEVEMKALQYINVGYQRILTFECKSGGFNWWEGDNPGNAVLSALAIMMLKDTQKVYDAVDDRVIQRAYDFLKGLQLGDGSWAENRHLHAGNENLGAGTLRSTCYITWGIVSGGFGDTPTARNAVKYIEKSVGNEKDLYTLGLCANALAAAQGDKGTLKQILDTIRAAQKKDGDKIFWEQTGQTLVYSGGLAANVELTALMALAFIASNTFTADIPKVVNWLVATKDPNGNWGYNTQATVLALKTFIAAAKLDTGDTKAEVKVLLNGKEVGARKFDNFNKDVLWQVELGAEQVGLKPYLAEGPRGALVEPDTVHKLTLDFNGTGNLGYQVVSTHFVPWVAGEKPVEPLTIDVRYDSKQIKVNDTVTVVAKLRKNDPKAEGMVLVTLGVPPGFDVMTEDLDGLRSKRVISQFELTGRQLLLYLDGLPMGEDVSVEYRLKARYPVKAQTGESEVRFYYQSDLKSKQAPQTIEVQ